MLRPLVLLAFALTLSVSAAPEVGKRLHPVPYFEENQGQSPDKSVKYFTRSPEGTVGFSRSGFRFGAPGEAAGSLTFSNLESPLEWHAFQRQSGVSLP